MALNEHRRLFQVRRDARGFGGRVPEEDAASGRLRVKFPWLPIEMSRLSLIGESKIGMSVGLKLPRLEEMDSSRLLMFDGPDQTNLQAAEAKIEEVYIGEAPASVRVSGQMIEEGSEEVKRLLTLGSIITDICVEDLATSLRATHNPIAAAGSSCALSRDCGDMR